MLQNRETPAWFPIEYQGNYNKTDLEYNPFCLKLFGQLEAAKRERFSPETMRQWFIEFVKRGWTKKMVMTRYNALLAKPIFGVEKLEIADWINAVQVYAEDEVNLKIDNKINNMINRGKYLKSNPDIELTEDDKKCLELELAQDLAFKQINNFFAKRESYKEERRRLWNQKFGI